MDVTSLGSRADQAVHRPEAEAKAGPSQTSAGGNADSSGGKGKVTGEKEPVVSPVIALDAETNQVVLKFQEAGGDVSFQLPGKAALQYEQHSKESVEGVTAAG